MIFSTSCTYVRKLAQQLKLIDVDLCSDPDAKRQNEICDGIDNNCNGEIDENLKPILADLINGVCINQYRVCDGINGWVEPNYTDINEYEVNEFSCDGIDNDCDGKTDEDLELPVADNILGICDGQTKICDSKNGWIEPDYFQVSGYEPEESFCDGMDNDCDGETDEDLTPPPVYGVCVGYDIYCDAENGWTKPNYSEITSYEKDETKCDGLDNDCDGLVDEGLIAPKADFIKGVCEGQTKICNGANGWGEPDYSSLENFEIRETNCDGLDNDCNGKIDNNLISPGSFGVCKEYDKVCHGTKGWIVEADYFSIKDYESNEVTCDSKDNDCDGILDEGCVLWKFETGKWVRSSPVIGRDKTIYFGSYDNKLYAINPNGTKKWEFLTGGWIHSSPTIGLDGTIYVTSFDKNLYAISPNGTEKWEFLTGDYIWSSPVVGPDDTIYFGSGDNYVYAINPDGSEKWSFETKDDIRSSPALSVDGTIYIGSWDNKLYAINPNGTKKWEFETEDDVRSSPAIGSDGTIYVGSWDNKLYALNPNGTKKWEYKTGDGIEASPIIDNSKTVFIGSWDSKLYAISPENRHNYMLPISLPNIKLDGTIYLSGTDNKEYSYIYSIKRETKETKNSNNFNKNKDELNIGGATTYSVTTAATKKWEFVSNGGISSSPVIGSNNILYFGSADGNIYAITTNGEKEWAVKTGGAVRSSGTISVDGVLYIGSGDGNLYAIKTTSFGISESPWPQFMGGNNKLAFTLWWPVKNYKYISSLFFNYKIQKDTRAKSHKAIDITAANGEIVRACRKGTVSFAGNDKRNSIIGNYIIISHNFGYKTVYGHLSTILIKEGQKVKTGERIGRVGQSGDSSTPHLHFEVRKDGRKINPLKFYNEREIRFKKGLLKKHW